MRGIRQKELLAKKGAINKNMKVLLICCLILFLTACGETKKTFTPLTENAVILAFGDSLTYGTGVNKEAGYPAILEVLSGFKVINEGIPGEISGSGLERLPGLLNEYEPQLLILIHGGNDILRKIPHEQTIRHLKQMISLAQQRNIRVVMLGVPKFSVFWLKSAEFYQDLAKQQNVPIDIEILPDILSSSELKSDNIHPNAAGYRLMAEAVYNLLEDNGAL